MAVLIRNISGEPVTLPFPYNGVIPGNEAMVLPGTKAAVVPTLGWPAYVESVFSLRDVPDSELLNSPTQGSVGAGVPATRQVIAGNGLTGGGALSGDVTLNVVANADGSIVVAANDMKVGVISVTQHGTLAGGTAHADAVAAVSSGFMSAADKTHLDALPAAAPPTSRKVDTGNGLTGGGDLTADRTLSAVAANGTITVGAPGIAVGVITGTEHGNLGGGSLHAAATNSVNGFMPSTDKARVDAQLSVVSRLFYYAAPLGNDHDHVHLDFAGNDASNNFPGPFTNPDIPRNVGVYFGVGWDGGNVIVNGTDQFDQAVTETYVANPGNFVVGIKVFKTVVSATKGAVGANPAAASIGIGDKMGISQHVVGAYGMLLADDTAETVTVDATYSAFTPFTVPDGGVNYKLLVNI